MSETIKITLLSQPVFHWWFVRKRLKWESIMDADDDDCLVHVLYLSSVLWCHLRFTHTHDVRFVFTSSCLLEGSCLIYVIYLFTYAQHIYFLLNVIFFSFFCLFFLYCPIQWKKYYVNQLYTVICIDHTAHCGRLDWQ
jgi:hypothetical protein